MPIHRLLFERDYGELPPGMCICHTCDNPMCINPDHLFMGTHSDNMKDKMLKGRAGKKLSKEDVETIRSELAEKKMTESELARVHGVSTSMISQISSRKCWNY